VLELKVKSLAMEMFKCQVRNLCAVSADWVQHSFYFIIFPPFYPQIGIIYKVQPELQVSGAQRFTWIGGNTECYAACFEFGPYRKKITAELILHQTGDTSIGFKTYYLSSSLV